jgi:uncharacterized membrane protein
MASESDRIMGGVGAALIAVNAISPILVLPALLSSYPTVASTLSPFSWTVSLAWFAGIILFMVAMKRFAVGYKTPSIFDNALYGILATIVVSVLAGAVMVIFIFMNFSNILSAFNPVPAPVNIQGIMGYMAPVMPIFALAGLVQSLFMMQAFNRLAEKSETYAFRNAGVALVASNMLTVVLACIGVLLFLATVISSTAALAIAFAGTAISNLAWIFPAKAFFTIKTTATQPSTTTPATEQTLHCPHCGAENLPDSAFCTRCGKKL